VGSLAEVGTVAGQLHKVLNLVLGNENFPQHFAAGQFAPAKQPADGFGADIELGGRLLDVIGQGLRFGRHCPRLDRGSSRRWGAMQGAGTGLRGQI